MASPLPSVRGRADLFRIALLYGLIVAATVAGFVAVWFAADRYAILLPLGILAFSLGVRHGVDADHICAIDNTTRKLLQSGQRPYTVGTWFSLGHATVVMALLVGFVFAARWIIARLPAFASVGGVVGAAISGGFLYLIALVNLVILVEVLGLFRALRSGQLDGPRLDAALGSGGFMNRYFGFLYRLVDRPWQIYPVGVLFGLGFDTATEVTLIAVTVTVGTAAAGLPLPLVLLLPFLFACGMVLTDTSDGVGMTFAYGWAFLKPVRKVYYNLTMTVISVLVAFVVGTVELLAVVASAFGLHGGAFGFWNAVGWLDAGTGPNAIDIWGYVGLAIVALFLGAWLVAWLVYRWKGWDEPPAGPRLPTATPRSG
jgi:nickel/cobalt transporter (NiCoT) family protein